ncbi:MAG: fused DSP-PTPase phosphatase/NAD kinase-like protein [Sarcina sp.]
MFFRKDLVKKYALALVVALSLGICIPVQSFASEKKANVLEVSVPIDQQTLVFDHDNHDGMPSNFRKTTDASSLSGKANIQGLETLNISGSQQFSVTGLKLLKQELPNPKNLVFMDLRQESHGFVNGLPISWEGDGNKANMGLSYEQVIQNNNHQLADLKVGSQLTIGKINLTVDNVYSEQTLVRNNGNRYARVTATDTMVPTAQDVDLFLSNLKNIPENSWIHFHCKEGIGRTTTFMTLYDILKNGDNVPLEDIVNRQILLANLEGKINSLESTDRETLYKNFSNYIKSKNENLSFSQYVANN